MEFTIKAEPFSWNHNMSEIALEDFSMIQKHLSYGTCQAIGMALAKLELLEKQGCRVDEDKPQTNADRIRAMSDEELSEFLLGIDHYWDDGQCIVGFDNAILNDSKSDILEWLKAEAEEGE